MTPKLNYILYEISKAEILLSESLKKNTASIQLARFHTEYKLGIRNVFIICGTYEATVTPPLQARDFVFIFQRPCLQSAKSLVQTHGGKKQRYRANYMIVNPPR